jgi:hypothetical protein
MIADPILAHPLLFAFGIGFCPGLTFCVLLWQMGHPLLGILAALSIACKSVD